MIWVCSFCSRDEAQPVHLHYAELEGFVITDHWSDGTRTQRTMWGAKIEGPVI